jgi:hypothetical protein
MSLRGWHSAAGALALGLLLVPSASTPQYPAPLPKVQKEEEEKRLPDGRLQSIAILKEEHKKSLEDVDEILRLAEDLKKELEKNEEFVLSIGSIRKAEDIEKLAKRVKSRLKRQ